MAALDDIESKISMHATAPNPLKKGLAPPKKYLLYPADYYSFLLPLISTVNPVSHNLV